MDPLSIACGVASLAVSGFTICKGIYAGYSHVVQVDSRLEYLFQEVQKLGKCLDAVSTSFQDSRLLALARDLRDNPSGATSELGLFNSTHVVLEDCENALSKLDATLMRISTVRTTPAFFRKPLVAFEIALKEDAIMAMREDVAKHIRAMELSVALVNNLLLRQFGATYDRLEQNVELLTQGMQALREEVVKGMQALRDEVKLGSESNKHLQNHLQVAEELRSDTTTYIGSLCGSVIEPEGDLFRAGSIRGLKSGDVRRIMRWNDSGRFSMETDDRDDHNRIILKRRLSLAKAKLEESKYEAAQKLFEKSIAEMQALEDVPPYKLREAEFSLCQTYKKQQKYELVLGKLDLLIQTNDLSAGEIHLVSFMRAETYLYQDKPSTALPHALKAMGGWYETAETDCAVYMQSCNLVADIYEALNDGDEATVYRQQAVAQRQLLQKQRSNSNPLRESQLSGSEIKADDQEVLNQLAQAGLNIESLEAINKAFLWAAENQKENAMQFLIRLGADLNCHSSMDWTPLTYASATGSVSQVEWLLNLGADVNGTADGSWTPLMAAAWVGRTSIAEMLIESGARLQTKSTTHETALQMARSRGHWDTALVLQEAEAKSCWGGEWSNFGM